MNTALQLWDGELSVITTPPPRVASPLEIVIKVAFTGVSALDLRVLSGKFPCPKSLILGHEFSGVVTEIGSEVKRCSVGERVVVNPHSKSDSFKAQAHLCFTNEISKSIGLGCNGGWAHYCRVPAALAHPIPTQITLEVAALAEPISCILHALDCIGNVYTDADILICGTGIIGLLFASIFHYRGYRRVTLTEISEQRRALASGLKLGFNIVHPDSLEVLYKRSIIKNTSTWGFDLIIDCTGMVAAIEQSFKWLRFGATFCIFGICLQESEVKISPYDILMKEIKVVGSILNSLTFPRSIQLIEDMGKDYLSYEKLGIKVYKLQDYAEAFSYLKSGKIAKAMFAI